MDSVGKSKMLHSMINKTKEGREMRGGVACEATTNFEGRNVHAVDEGQIKKLLAAYTSYVSMDSTDKGNSEEMDAKPKRNMTSFTVTGDIQNIFDEEAREQVVRRSALIGGEYSKREHCTREITGGNIHQKRNENSYEGVENQVLETDWSR